MKLNNKHDADFHHNHVLLKFVTVAFSPFLPEIIMNDNMYLYSQELHTCMQITAVSHSQVLKFQFWSWAYLRGSMLLSFLVFWCVFSALSSLWSSSVSVTGGDIAVR